MKLFYLVVDGQCPPSQDNIGERFGESFILFAWRKEEKEDTSTTNVPENNGRKKTRKTKKPKRIVGKIKRLPHEITES